MIAMGDSNTDSRAKDAVDRALNSPLLDVDISGAKGALINICGNHDMTLKEAQTSVQIISDELQTDAEIIYGVMIEPELGNIMQVTLVISGVKSPYIMGSEDGFEPEEDGLDLTDLGLPRL